MGGFLFAKPYSRKVLQQLGIDGGYGHEQIDCGWLCSENVPDLGSIERSQHGDTGPHCEGTQQAVHNPMSVVKRQHMEDFVFLGPLPGRDEALGLVLHITVRQDNTFWGTSCTACVQDHGGVIRTDYCRVKFNSIIFSSLSHHHHLHTKTRHHVLHILSNYDKTCLTILHIILQRRCWM